MNLDTAGDELKGSPELIQPAIFTPSEGEVLQKVQSQLINAIALLESVQESECPFCLSATSVTDPVKMSAEKRRNKFEFIRFGRR